MLTVDRCPDRRVFKLITPTEVCTVLKYTKGIAAGRVLIGVVAPGYQIPVIGKMGSKIIRLNRNN